MHAKVEIEQALYEALKETDLLVFKGKLAVNKQLTRLEHFDDVTDDELRSYGLSTPAIRRLRNAIEKQKKLANKKSKLFRSKQKLIPVSYDPEQASASTTNYYYDSTMGATTPTTMPCLISRDELKLMEVIGEGTFAIVKRAIWQQQNGQKLECAVKILRDVSEQIKQDLYAEITNMYKLSHQNLVRLHGVVFGEPTTLMVIEYCANGALLDRLRATNRERFLVTRLLNYAQQIASGMTYLESKRYVHRDLAARNVLLSENEEIVKICDFGLTRPLHENERLYVMSTPKKVPFSWCPPESLRFRQFSHKSDVWSFGITLWELFTYGEEPWIGCKAIDVLKLTESGERLIRPKYCSNEIYDIMKMCWNLCADNRPKFGHLRNLLHDIKFMTVVCRCGQYNNNNNNNKSTNNDKNLLQFEVNERLILISEEDNELWFGQSLATRKFGYFPRNLVTVRITQRTSSNNTATMTNNNQNYMDSQRKHISHPIAGSFVHTGHGDTNENKCWGYVEKIDEIYLRNPVLNNHLNGSLPKNMAFSSIFKEDGEKSTPPTILSKQQKNQQYNIQELFIVDKNSQDDNLDTFKNDQFNNFTVDNNKSTSLFTLPAPINNINEPPISNSLNNTNLEILNFNKMNNLKEFKIPKISKYDSSISVNRPNGYLAISRKDITQITPPPIKAHNFISPMVSKPSTSSLPSSSSSRCQSVILESTNTNKNIENLNTKLFSELSLDKFGQTLHSSIPQKTHNINYKDPFVITEEIKHLAQKPRYNDVMAILSSNTNLQFSSNFNEKLPTPVKSVSNLANLDTPTSNMANNSVQKHQILSSNSNLMFPSNFNENLPTAIISAQNMANSNGAKFAQNHSLNLSNKNLPFSSNFIEKNENAIISADINSNSKLILPLLSNNNLEEAAKPSNDCFELLAKPPSKVKANKTTNYGNLLPFSTNQNAINSTKNDKFILPQTTMANSLNNGIKNELPLTPDLPLNSTHNNNKNNNTSNYTSLLPPPSELLLSGISEKKSESKNPQQQQQQQKQQMLPLQQQILQAQQQKQQQTKSQNSLLNPINYQPIFSIGGTNNNTNNFLLKNCEHQRLTYGANGIPILEPLRNDLILTTTTTTSNNPQQQQINNNKSIKQQSQFIDLCDLDTDQLIAKVQSLVDFANIEQCRLMLRKNGFDVENAVRGLKIEKLLEMGLANNREMASNTLASCQWDVNAAANQLVS